MIKINSSKQEDFTSSTRKSTLSFDQHIRSSSIQSLENKKEDGSQSISMKRRNSVRLKKQGAEDLQKKKTSLLRFNKIQSDSVVLKKTRNNSISVSQTNDSPSTRANRSSSILPKFLQQGSSQNTFSILTWDDLLADKQTTEAFSRFLEGKILIKKQNKELLLSHFNFLKEVHNLLTSCDSTKLMYDSEEIEVFAQEATRIYNLFINPNPMLYKDKNRTFALLAFSTDQPLQFEDLARKVKHLEHTAFPELFEKACQYSQEKLSSQFEAFKKNLK